MGNTIRIPFTFCADAINTKETFQVFEADFGTGSTFTAIKPVDNKLVILETLRCVLTRTTALEHSSIGLSCIAKLPVILQSPLSLN